MQHKCPYCVETLMDDWEYAQHVRAHIKAVREEGESDPRPWTVEEVGTDEGID